MRAESGIIKLVEVVIGVVRRDDGRVLICRRPAGKPLAGFWEFPGGKREPRESPEECLVRELREELAIQVRPDGEFEPISFEYPTTHVVLRPYLCTLLDGEPRPLASDELTWVLPHELAGYEFPPANKGLIRAIQRRFDDTAPRRDGAREPARPAGPAQ